MNDLVNDGCVDRYYILEWFKITEREFIKGKEVKV